MKQPTYVRLLTAFAVIVASRDAATAWSATDESLAPNPDFRDGTDAPTGWRLSGGQGRWVDRQIVEVTGTGSGSNQWQSEPVQFKPGGLYRFQMRARQVAGSGGCIISGPSFANRDYPGLASEWTNYGHVFRVPDGVQNDYLRVGQWESKATLQFDSVRLARVIPVHKQIGGLLLGEGESIKDGRYVFQGSFGHEGSNFHRTLLSATAGFNSTRWCFGGGQVTYRFGLPGHRFLSGDAAITLGWHSRGGCLVEASRDGQSWRPVAKQNGLGAAKATLPADLFPAQAIFLRLRPAGEDSNFQIFQVEFQAKLEGRPPEGVGKTIFGEVASSDYEKAIESITLDDDANSGQAVIRVMGKNPTERPLTAVLAASVKSPDGKSAVLASEKAAIAAGGKATLQIKIPARQSGRHEIALDAAVGPLPPLHTTLHFDVPAFYRSDYGELIDGHGETAVWWCDATWKVPRHRPSPAGSGAEVRLSAAKNDREAVQIVVRPKQGLHGLTASAGPLVGRNGAAIPAENIKVLRVNYHFVDHPTDGTGARDWWPDALPPLSGPIDVPAGENQPLWVLVHVPKDAKAGDYTGTMSLKAEGFSAKVPTKLHVWDFALPERNHLETAFGFNPHEVFRYHQAKTDADKRKLLDRYFQSFAEHRISTYDPTPLDPFHVKFLPDAKPPRAEIDFAAFDRAMTAAVEKYHFTNFSLPIHGMGGGTFHERYEPSIDKFGEKTPEYQAMFASQVREIEQHLREKGWLKLAYVYWFDEPDPKDYAFVRNGMERLKRYAPGIQRMLTEEPGDALAGAVDIWCPVSFNYNHDAAEKRRACGDRFWWYVCCGPKAPFCTLFIDHPATELRVWHWQTWQRKIAGTLVWASNYWTSEAAYPDKAQNPYEDPMSYVSGYSTPKGTKNYWGNGDGRFIYPPEAAAVPGKSGPATVLEGPVSSIRWEMLREGVEDYEFLWLLRDLLSKKRGGLTPDEVRQYESLLEVPVSITKDMTTFTTDPGPIYARRAAIAEAIERLSR
jgi:hypothetical protein